MEWLRINIRFVYWISFHSTKLEHESCTFHAKKLANVFFLFQRQIYHKKAIFKIYLNPMSKSIFSAFCKLYGLIEHLLERMWINSGSSIVSLFTLKSQNTFKSCSVHTWKLSLFFFLFQLHNQHIKEHKFKLFFDPV